MTNHSSNRTLLSVENLRTWFELRKFGFVHVGDVKAVDDVSFQLQRGESVAFVGESGCGKSTLARTVLGLHRPTGGKVVFDGRDLMHLDAGGRKWYHSQVGYVQQDPYGALPPFMSVQKILSEPLLINGMGDRNEREKRIYETLEEVRLLPVEDLLPKFPHMLSGGQQQRLVIARAIVLRPQLIVADEPVSMLDASVRVEILNLLRGIQDSYNLTLIYITHDLSTVRYFASKIFVMYAGRILEQAHVDELLEYPQHPYTQALLRAISDPEPENAKVYKDLPPGEPPSLITPPAGCRFHPRCPAIIKGTCDLKAPPYLEPRPNHLSLCWLHKEKGR